MSYCHIHGRSGDHEDGCPLCRDAQERAESDLAEVIALLKAIRNPGDYECPHCGRIALKKQFSRCGHCQGVVEQSYWQIIEAREQAAAKDAQEAHLRHAKEMEIWRLERQRAARHQWKRESLIRTYSRFYLYFLPGISLLTALLVGLASPGPGNRVANYGCFVALAVIPVANWVICLGSIFERTPVRGAFVAIFLVWAIGGAFGIHFLIARVANRKNFTA